MNRNLENTYGSLLPLRTPYWINGLQFPLSFLWVSSLSLSPPWPTSVESRWDVEAPLEGQLEVDCVVVGGALPSKPFRARRTGKTEEPSRVQGRRL